MYAFSGLVGVLIQAGGIGPLVKTFGESALVQIGFAAMAAGFVLMSGVYYIPYLLLAIALLTFGHAVLRPSLTSLITKRVARTRQGMVIGLMQSLMSITQIVAPICAGILIQNQFLGTWAWTGGLVCGVGLSLIAAAK